MDDSLTRRCGVRLPSWAPEVGDVLKNLTMHGFGTEGTSEYCPVVDVCVDRAVGFFEVLITILDGGVMVKYRYMSSPTNAWFDTHWKIV